VCKKRDEKEGDMRSDTIEERGLRKNKGRQSSKNDYLLISVVETGQQTKDRPSLAGRSRVFRKSRRVSSLPVGGTRERQRSEECCDHANTTY